LRERLGVDDIILVLQQNRLRWYGHVLRKEDSDWLKKCTEFIHRVVDWWRAPNQEVVKKGHGERFIQKDCQALTLTWRMLWIIVDGRS